ncbi:MAG: hypothetical protein KGL67_01305 [Patescibacteria group bacterium]|nr:hypothetical protein [Patescibacteria group bacterium]
MPIIDIHGKKVSIPEGSDSAKHAAHFLEKNPENAKAFFDEAKLNVYTGSKTGLTHFTTNKPGGYHGATEFTLIHTGHDQYELRKREHHIF